MPEVRSGVCRLQRDGAWRSIQRMTEAEMLEKWGPFPKAPTEEEQKAGRRGTTAWREGYEEGQRAEREACAQVADGLNVEALSGADSRRSAATSTRERIAALIRARGQGYPVSPLAQARSLLRRARTMVRQHLGVGPSGEEVEALAAEIDAFLAGLPITSTADKTECGAVEVIMNGCGPVCTEPQGHEGDHVAVDRTNTRRGVGGLEISRWSK